MCSYDKIPSTQVQSSSITTAVDVCYDTWYSALCCCTGYHSANIINTSLILVNYIITGQIGARRRVFILVAPRGSEHFVDQSIDASNLSPPRGGIHIVSSRPSSIFNGLARHEAGGRGLIICRGGRPIFTCIVLLCACLLYTSPSPRDLSTSRMPSSA